MKQKGSFTIEASFLIPIVTFVILILMQISFFLYNREAVTVLAAQAALQGVQMEQEGKNTIQKSLEKFLAKETGERLLFTDQVTWDVSVTPVTVKVSITLSQKTIFKILSCKVEQKMTRQNPATVLWESERWSRQ